MKRRFVLLDRDGTVIAKRHYLADPAGVELIDGVAAAIRGLRDCGFGVVLITNQSGIGRGYITPEQYQRVHHRMIALLAEQGAVVDGAYFCPHTPDDGCDCRKPRPGMIRRAAEQLGFDPSKGFLVGDNPCDVELGKLVGATTFLVRTGDGAANEAAGYGEADHIVDDLGAVVERTKRAQSRKPRT